MIIPPRPPHPPITPLTRRILPRTPTILPIPPRRMQLHHKRLSLRTLLPLLPKTIRVDYGGQPPVSTKVRHAIHCRRVGVVVVFAGRRGEELESDGFGVGYVRCGACEKGVSVDCCSEESGGAGVWEGGSVVCVVGK